MRISKELPSFIENVLEKEFVVDLNPPNVSWHYTNLDALYGILAGKKLRFSNTRFLNDPEEIRYGQRLVREVLEGFTVADDKSARQFREDYLRFEQNEQSYEPYVLSLCEEGNDLNLWRAYGREGEGVAIGFELPSLRSEIERIDQGIGSRPWVYVSRVLYKDDRQRVLIQRVLEFGLESYLQQSLANGDDGIKETFFKVFLALVSYLLPLIKSDGYGGEREVRVVLHGKDAKYARMEFAPSRGYFRPYIGLNYADKSTERFPIRQIRSGPRVDYDLFRRSTEIILAKYDLAVDIDQSGIAYRG